MSSIPDRWGGCMQIVNIEAAHHRRSKDDLEPESRRPKVMRANGGLCFPSCWQGWYTVRYGGTART